MTARGESRGLQRGAGSFLNPRYDVGLRMACSLHLPLLLWMGVSRVACPTQQMYSSSGSPGLERVSRVSCWKLFPSCELAAPGSILHSAVSCRVTAAARSLAAPLGNAPGYSSSGPLPPLRSPAWAQRCPTPLGDAGDLRRETASNWDRSHQGHLIAQPRYGHITSHHLGHC